MTDDFKRDKQICEAATPGPWYSDQGNWQVESRNKLVWRAGICSFTPEDREGLPSYPNTVDPFDDAEFIAAARTRWPAALDEITRLTSRIEELEDERNQWKAECIKQATRVGQLEGENTRLRAALDHYAHGGCGCAAGCRHCDKAREALKE